MRDPSFAGHADCHSFAMQERITCKFLQKVAFHGMADGVSKIKRLANAFFRRIRFGEEQLDFDRFGNGFVPI